MPLTIEFSPTGYIGKLMLGQGLGQGLRQGGKQTSKVLVPGVVTNRCGKTPRTYAARFNQLNGARAATLLESIFTVASLKEPFDARK